MRPYYFDFERYRRQDDPPCGRRELVELFHGGAELMRLWWRRSRGRRDLARLDAHGLRDIGVTPYEADNECNKPFWRA